MKIWHRFFVVSVFGVFLVFQNCSEFEAKKQGAVYPFQTQPQYFYDLQISDIEFLPGNDDIYVFDFAIADAEDPLAEVQYTLKFLGATSPERSSGESELCPERSGQALSGQVHERYSCRSSIPRFSMAVEIQVTAPHREPESIRLYFEGIQDAKENARFPVQGHRAL